MKRSINQVAVLVLFYLSTFSFGAYMAYLGFSIFTYQWWLIAANLVVMLITFKELGD